MTIRVRTPTVATINTDVDFSQSRQTEVHLVGWVFTDIAIATVGLKSRRGIWCTGSAAVAEHGMERVSTTSKWQILGYFFNIVLLLPNISIAILINNLQDPKPLRALLLGMSIMQVVFAMVSVFLIFLQCKPTAALGPSRLLRRLLLDQRVHDHDRYHACLVPITVFWKLQMRQITKIGVCIMMGLTLLSTIVTIVKTTYLPLFIDVEYTVTPLVTWGLIEQNVVIVAACTLTLRLFFRLAVESRGSSNRSTSLGSGITLTSTVRSKRHTTAAELALEETQNPNEHYMEFRLSHSSRQGIRQSREVIVEGDEEIKRIRGLRNVVPSNLR
ncbi:hypothetical protein BDV11DRAFT_203699 [Aspergillus similis]